MRFKLLTPAASNAKMKKNDTDNYLGAILHLAPHALSGFNVCPWASEGCAKACLNTAGRGAFSNVQAARIRKTQLLRSNRELFDNYLREDLDLLLRTATKRGLKPYARLNGTSDLDWLGLIREFSDIQFYDYTKSIGRIKRHRQYDIANYQITFSASESNHKETCEALAMGINVAMVFDTIPETYNNYKVINGDASDLRFLDPSEPIGLIVGLKAKGKAKQDKTGFVRRINI